jgi:CheY-like chemotaxis protein
MHTINILLVEDNPADARLVFEAMAEHRFHAEFHHVLDGMEAMAFLRREAPYEGKPRPDLVLLDLNMPRMDGREVLANVKGDPKLATIPVIVLTTSDTETDVVRSYLNHANCFLTKPVDFDAFVHMIQLATDFWLTAVRLPNKGG